MTEYVREWEDVYRALINDVLRRIEFALQPFANSLDAFLAELFSARLPSDWRERWHNFVDDQEARGFLVEPVSVEELETWIERWARFCGLLPTDPENSEQDSRAHESDLPAAPPAETSPYLITTLIAELDDAVAALAERPGTPSIAHPSGTVDPSDFGRQAEELDPRFVGFRFNPQGTRPSGRGDQTGFGDEAERIVSKSIGVELNPKKGRRHRFPGKAPVNSRFPDFKIWGRTGSFRLRGSIIEVKASTEDSFGALSSRSREQIQDAVSFALRLRAKANKAKTLEVRLRLRHAHVEVFSDLPAPTSGTFRRMMDDRLLRWNRIPRPSPPPPPKSISKPGLGTTTNVALGLTISLVEANVADSFYRKCARSLADLLSQMLKYGDASEEQWARIEGRLREIAAMQQSYIGHAWELISYGQGSLTEKKALAMLTLGQQLAEEHGYQYTSSWGDIL